MAIAEWVGNQHQQGFVGNLIDPAFIFVQVKNSGVKFLSMHETESNYDGSALHYAYLSPEQTGRMKWMIDERSDLYVLGILFYELLSGSLPYEAHSVDQWMHAHMALRPTPLYERNPEVPPVLHDMGMKLLSKIPQYRYQSIQGLMHDLRICRNQITTQGFVERFPIGEADAKSQIRFPRKLYNRDKEIEMLDDVLEQTCSGSSACLLIGGHAGSGKSSLVQALRQQVVQKKGTLISGTCDHIHPSAPYAPFIDALQDMVQQILSQDEQHMMQWRHKLLDAIGHNGRLLTDVIPEMTLIIGEQESVEELPPAEATYRFQKLVSNVLRSLSSENSPLVLWIDNVQWADSATFDLLDVIVHDAAFAYTCLIGTYRNNVCEDGGFVKTRLQEVEPGEGFQVYNLTLSALDYENVLQYVADVVHDEPSRVHSLAEALYQQTAGNPFYMKEMLQFLHDKEQLYFNWDTLNWNWKMDWLEVHEGFQDVVGLIQDKFDHLPEQTRQLISLASCIGHRFELQMVAMLSEASIDDTRQYLMPAVREGLVMQREEETYTFLHDQVHEAAYALIHSDQKRTLHLQIGRSMVRHMQSGQRENYLFEIVHHLNRGNALVTEPEELEQLAQLNLQAGQKAKASAAYGQALEWLKQGARLVEGMPQFDTLYYELLFESAECEYVCGNFQQAEVVMQQLLQQAEQLVDRMKVYVMQITMYGYRNQEDEASTIAQTAFAELGLSIPKDPSGIRVVTEMARTQLWLARNKRTLHRMPVNRSPLYRVTGELFNAASSILFIANERASMVLICKYIRMVMRQGHTEGLSFALGSYAIAISAGFHQYKWATQLAEIALFNAEKEERTLLKGKLYFSLGLVLQYQRPQAGMHYFQEAAKLSLESGDRLYAGYAVSSLLIIGSHDLRQLQAWCDHYHASMKQTLDAMTSRVLLITMRYVSLLQARPVSGMTFNHGQLTEANLFHDKSATHSHNSNRYYYYTSQLEIYYVYGYYDEALAAAQTSMHLESKPTLTFKHRHYFYHALSLLALYPGADAVTQKRYSQTLKALVTRMKQWAKTAPGKHVSQSKLGSGRMGPYHGQCNEGGAIVCASDRTSERDRLSAG